MTFTSDSIRFIGGYFICLPPVAQPRGFGEPYNYW